MGPNIFIWFHPTNFLRIEGCHHPHENRPEFHRFQGNETRSFRRDLDVMRLGLPLFYFPTATWVEDGGHHLVSLPGWWFQPTHLKKMLVNMGIFPNFRGEHKKCLKPPPPPSYSYFSGLFVLWLDSHYWKVTKKKSWLLTTYPSHGMILQVGGWGLSGAHLDFHWGDEHPLPLGHEGLVPRLHPRRLTARTWKWWFGRWFLPRVKTLRFHVNLPACTTSKQPGSFSLWTFQSTLILLRWGHISPSSSLLLNKNRIDALKIANLKRNMFATCNSSE